MMPTVDEVRAVDPTACEDAACHECYVAPYADDEPEPEPFKPSALCNTLLDRAHRLTRNLERASMFSPRLIRRARVAQAAYLRQLRAELTAHDEAVANG